MINFIENSLFFGAALSLAGYEVGLLLKKKLAIVYMLLVFSFDKLVLYAFLDRKSVV